MTKRFSFFRVFQTLLFLVAILTTAIMITIPVVQGKIDKNGEEHYGRAIFLENKGQWPANILFRAKVPNGFLFITDKGYGYTFFDPEPFAKDGHFHSEDGKLSGEAIQINFLGINKITQAFGLQSGGTLVNFHVNKGDQNKQDVQGAKLYSAVVVPNIYPGIDWKIFTNLTDQIKHEFIVNPGADYKLIQLAYEGVNDCAVKEKQLDVKTKFQKITEGVPLMYYNSGLKNTFEGKYKLSKGSKVSFEIPQENYDQSKQLIIDPLLVFSTYSGSIADNWGFTATFGENGTAYSGGIVFDSGFPTTAGTFDITYADSVDIGILKYSADGTKLLYATYLGGKGLDVPHSLIIDNNNDLLIYGTTSSIDFPVSTNAYAKVKKRGKANSKSSGLETGEASEIFVSKLSPDGSTLIASTYIGGKGMDGILVNENTIKNTNGKLYNNYGDNFRGDMAIDSFNNVYVSSVTESQDFPVFRGNLTFNGGENDGIIFKFNPELSLLIWSTFIGGTGDDAVYSMALNQADNEIIFCGGSSSSSMGFPNTNALRLNSNGDNDGFVGVIDIRNGRLKRGTFLGTTNKDQAYFVDTDSNNDIFVLGQTFGSYPVSSGVYSNPNSGIFMQKLNQDLSQSLLSTVIGAGRNKPDISPTAFLVNECDNIFITGYGNPYSLNTKTGNTFGLPITNDAFQKTTDGADFYLMNIKKDFNALLYATYFGGNETKNGKVVSGEHVDGGTSRFNKAGIIYHTVCASCGGTNAFPATPNAYSTVNRSENCNNAIFKFDLASLIAGFETFDENNETAGFIAGCIPLTINFQNKSVGGKTFTWDFGDGTTLQQAGNVRHTYNQPGEFTVKLSVFDDNTCTQTDEFTRTIYVYDDPYTVSNDTEICEGESYELSVTNGYRIFWKTKDGSIVSNESKFVVSPKVTTSYVVTGATAIGCKFRRVVVVKVKPHIKADFDINNLDSKENNITIACTPANIEFSNLSSHGVIFEWDFGDGTTSTDSLSPKHTYNRPGVYQITLKVTNPNSCELTDSITKTISIFDTGINIPNSASFCLDEELSFNAGSLVNPIWRDNNNTVIGSESVLTFKPTESTTISIEGKTTRGCVYQQNINLIKNGTEEINFRVLGKNGCIGDRTYQVDVFQEVQGTISRLDNNTSWVVDMGDGTKYTQPTFVHTYKQNGQYQVVLKGKKGNCDFELQKTIYAPNLFVPNVITQNDDGKNETFKIIHTQPINITIYNRWGRKIDSFEDYQSNWPIKPIKAGWYFYDLNMENGSQCNGWVHLRKSRS